MAIRLQNDQLSQALEHLKTFKNHADVLKISGHLDSEIRHPFGQKFFVDKWPDFDIIVDSIRENTIAFYPSFTFTTRIHNEERLKDFLEQIIEPLGSRKLFCEGVPSRFLKMLEDLGKKWKTSYSEFDHNFIMTTDRDNLKLTPLPEGYTADSVRLEDAEFITSKWGFSSLNDSTIQMIKYDIENRPSVAIRDKDGKLVGWELVHIFGSPGVLEVVPEHRGKGLGKYLVGALAQKLLDEGRAVFVVVEKSNVQSINLHKKCGFQTAEGTDAHWGYFAPTKTGK